MVSPFASGLDVSISHQKWERFSLHGIAYNCRGCLFLFLYHPVGWHHSKDVIVAGDQSALLYMKPILGVWGFCFVPAKYK